jgi:hypothetical protein
MKKKGRPKLFWALSQGDKGEERRERKEGRGGYQGRMDQAKRIQLEWWEQVYQGWVTGVEVFDKDGQIKAGPGETDRLPPLFDQTCKLLKLFPPD